MATGYIFTKTGNNSTKVVHVTNGVVDLGRTKVFKGPVLIEENDSSLISIKEGGGNAMSLNIGAILTIDGSAPAGTMEGIIDQLDAVFPDASTTGGSGGGVFADFVGTEWLGTYKQVNLTGNLALTTTASSQPGSVFMFKQDGTGGHGVTLNNGALPISTTANAVTFIVLMEDSSGNLMGVPDRGFFAINPIGYAPPAIQDVTLNLHTGLTESPSRQWNGDNLVTGVDTIHTVASGSDVLFYANLTGSVNDTVYIGLDTNNTENVAYSPGGVWKFSVTAGLNVLGWVEQGVTLAVTGAITLPYHATDSLFGIRITGGIVEAVYSSDAGVTWTVAHTFSNTYSGTLYPKAYFGTSGKTLLNPKIVL